MIRSWTLSWRVTPQWVVEDLDLPTVCFFKIFTRKYLSNISRLLVSKPFYMRCYIFFRFSLVKIYIALIHHFYGVTSLEKTSITSAEQRHETPASLKRHMDVHSIIIYQLWLCNYCDFISIFSSERCISKVHLFD